MLVLHLVLLLISCFVLVKSSSLLVRALSKISAFVGLNEFAIGFIIMAISTSLPELFVGITSGIENNSALALGNVIGSNILDLTIVIGIVTLLARGIKIKSKLIKKDIFYMLGMVILPILLMIDEKLGRIDGVILLGVFGLYIWQMLKQERRFSKKMNEVKKIEAVRWLVVAVISIIVLMISADFVVEFGTKISIELFLPPILVGIFIVSFGTSLPELIFESKAVLEKHEELAIGDLIGSVISNSTLVLGVTALISPIKANFILFFSGALFMVLISFIFMTFAESEKGISWKEGISLILLYVFFVIIEAYIKSIT
ncbi:MAG: Sodium/calcium exchanger MaX1 [Candidatus Woesearchaeota archaeon]|nr:Sodium/calcium exchanger MaX1 [Candidatus Woesearchaeota archaeon]